MNVLVVGGAGYVGSHAVRALQRAGHIVWVYDNLSRGHIEAVDRELFIEGDLEDRHRLGQILSSRGIEAVLHFAAFALVSESVDEPALYYRNNIIASLELLEAMRETGVKKIVFSSTTATYGEPRVSPILETCPQHPINPYGFTKYVVENALRDYSRAYGMAYAALRYFNAAGADPSGDIGEDHSPETHLIPLVLQVALMQRSEVKVYGDSYLTIDGTCVRDYVHVCDLADAHVLALSVLETNRELVLNLGTGKGTSVRQIIESCRRVTGTKIPFSIAPPRKGDPAELVADARKAFEVLGWRPRFTDIDEIIKTAWKWHREHPLGFENRCHGR